MNCHASVNLPAAIPGWTDGEPKVGNASDRGSFLHEIMAMVASLPPSEADAIMQAIGYLLALTRKRRFKKLIEEKMQVTWLRFCPTTTPDLVLYVQDELHIIDWKFGKIHVDVNENQQLLYYAATAAHLAPKATGVYVHIVQPLDKEWDATDSVRYIPAQELQAYMQEVQDAETAIDVGDLTFGVGDHCQFCPANPHTRGTKGSPACPAMMRVLYPSTQELRDNLIEEGDEFFDSSA